jgi:hypothetical protein
MLYGYRVRLARAQRTGDTTLAARMAALIAAAESQLETPTAEEEVGQTRQSTTE